MADLKISQLTAAGALTGVELVEAVQGGLNVKTTTQAIADLGGGGSAASESTAGIAELATQAETNTGTDDARIVTPLKLTNATAVTNKQLLVNSATVITDAASMDITAIKNTLTTSSATRTFTISYTGDDITLVVTLNALSSLFTFPATSLCVSEGVASGNNTLSLAGVSGDKYLISIKKVGSDYYVFCKNVGQ